MDGHLGLERHWARSASAGLARGPARPALWSVGIRVIQGWLLALGTLAPNCAICASFFPSEYQITVFKLKDYLCRIGHDNS